MCCSDVTLTSGDVTADQHLTDRCHMGSMEHEHDEEKLRSDGAVAPSAGQLRCYRGDTGNKLSTGEPTGEL